MRLIARAVFLSLIDGRGWTGWDDGGCRQSPRDWP
jgi:hypothetical protein